LRTLNRQTEELRQREKDEHSEDMRRVEVELRKTQASLEVRGLTVDELTQVIATMHAVREKEMAIAVMKTSYAKTGGAPHGRYVPD